MKEFQASSEEVEFIGLNRNGEIVVVDESNERNPSIQRWNTSGKQIQRFNVGQELGYTVLNRDKNLIAGTLESEPDNSFTRLWDSSGTVIAEKLPGYLTEFSPKGESLATIDEKAGTVYLWRANGTLIRELPGYQGIKGAYFSADGQLVIVRHGDSVRSIWDISGRLVLNLPEMQGGVKSAWFSPTDSKLLVTVGNDGTIKLLRLDDRQTLLQTACNQISTYLQSEASDLSDSDRRLCDGIIPSPSQSPLNRRNSP
ncbi:MAG: hypothetical protein HC881_04170 [Leptolyngbyaceae cyanobacterium SL_7_1]|nr:hypothetical protein [Leptolyngbyaceae cyanobacterium SL_7_1]